MTSKLDSSDQVKFLVTCIRHSNNGRPEFTAVANELGIVSKAAAQKRYERMLKANNVSSKNSTPTKAGDAEGGAPASSAAKKRGSRAAGNPAEDTPTKKRARPAKTKTVKKESDDEKDTKPPKEPKAESAVKDQSDSELSDAPPSSKEDEV